MSCKPKIEATCDRCGRTQLCDGDINVFSTPKGWSGLQLSHTGKVEKNHDLCDICTNALRHWLVRKNEGGFPLESQPLERLITAVRTFRESDHSFGRQPTLEGQAVLDAMDEYEGRRLTSQVKS